MKKRDREAVAAFARGDISLREAQRKMKLRSTSIVYIRAFHLLQELI